VQPSLVRRKAARRPARLPDAGAEGAGAEGAGCRRLPSGVRERALPGATEIGPAGSA
jgi:hypothetical protein